MTLTVHSILASAVASAPDALAATLGEESQTFRQVQAQTLRYESVLRHLGLREGDRLVLQASFDLDQIALFFASQRIGVSVAPLNPAFSRAELEPLLAYLKPRMLVQDAGCAAICAGLFAQEPPAPGAPAPLHAVLGDTAAAPGQVALGPLLARARPAPQAGAPVDPDSIHAIFLTSGSTGQPKGVMLSHRASWLRSHMGASRCSAAGGRGELITFPMFHWAGWNYLLENWAHKRPAHFLETSSGDDIARAIARHDPAYLYAIPALWERILASDVPFDGSRVRSVGCGTSRFDFALMDRLSERFPRAHRGVFYGSTEFGSSCTLVDDEIANRPGSVGLPNAGVEARLVEGELWLRGITAMSGYFELPDQTAEVLRDGWYATGDLAEIDADGFVSVTGRAREVIRSGGETIAPAEVELALRGFPGLRAVAIIGVSDPTWGEIVCAVTELEDGAGCPEVGALRAYLDGRIAPYKHPRRVIALPELPRTPATGQIMRARLKSLVQTGVA